jgi:hypothetical protein
MQATDHNQQQHAPGALSQLAGGPEELPGNRGNRGCDRPRGG